MVESKLSRELKLRYSPVAIILSDEKPDDALMFIEGRWGCVIAMLSAAAKGKTAAFDSATVTCGGGKIGLGFCAEFEGPPGGIEYFLSTGKGEGYPEGEAYKKTPELARAFVEDLPTTIVPTKYVLFKPLSEVNLETEKPEVIVFLVNPDQLSALTVLANYDRETSDNVSLKFGAGCHQIFLLPYAEAKKDQPKAILGVTDITARPFVDPDLLSFAVPYSMFCEMESNMAGSFLEKHDWQRVRERI